MMDGSASPSHLAWRRTRYVVFRPGCRGRTVYSGIRQRPGRAFPALAEWGERRIDEGHLMPDHLHTMISILPQRAAPQVIGIVKRNGAIHLARVAESTSATSSVSTWGQAQYVSTVDGDERAIREYIRNQETEDERFGTVRTLAKCAAASWLDPIGGTLATLPAASNSTRTGGHEFAGESLPSA